MHYSGLGLRFQPRAINQKMLIDFHSLRLSFSNLSTLYRILESAMFFYYLIRVFTMICGCVFANTFHSRSLFSTVTEITVLANGVGVDENLFEFCVLLANLCTQINVISEREQTLFTIDFFFLSFAFSFCTNFLLDYDEIFFCHKLSFL